MVASNALTRVQEEERERFLGADFNVEDPVVLQLGGSDADQMARAARLAAEHGYKEININCGCPSEKVAGAGCFGAALMMEPEKVADMAVAVTEATGRAPSIKCRIGVNDRDSYEELSNFVTTVAERGMSPQLPSSRKIEKANVPPNSLYFLLLI
jgi:tRNA-dihydrouridine synthase A